MNVVEYGAATRGIKMLIVDYFASIFHLVNVCLLPEKMIRYCLIFWLFSFHSSVIFGHHFDGALGHQLMHGTNELSTSSSSIHQHQYLGDNHPNLIAKHVENYVPGYLQTEPRMDPGLVKFAAADPIPHPEVIAHTVNSVHPDKLRFDTAELAIHGYDNHNHNDNDGHIVAVPEPHLHHHHHLSFYDHHKPGDGFGPGGHFSVMPKQEIKYFPVPEPIPIYKPVPVEKPYPVPVDKPIPVKVDLPIPEPYVAKVIQPIIHKQAIIKSMVTHKTYDIPYMKQHHHHDHYDPHHHQKA